MSDIFIFSGAPASGKSTTAKALMQKFKLGIHIPVDDLRDWVVSGIAPPVPVWTDETTRQFGLARTAAANVARLYADAGFAIAIDDVIFPDEAEEFYVKPFAGHTVHKILLYPDLETTLARNASRTNKNFDHAILIETIKGIYQAIKREDFEAKSWVVMDNGKMDLEAMVKKILEE